MHTETTYIGNTNVYNKLLPFMKNDHFDVREWPSVLFSQHSGKQLQETLHLGTLPTVSELIPAAYMPLYRKRNNYYRKKLFYTKHKLTCSKIYGHRVLRVSRYSHTVIESPEAVHAEVLLVYAALIKTHPLFAKQLPHINSKVGKQGSILQTKHN